MGDGPVPGHSGTGAQLRLAVAPPVAPGPPHPPSCLGQIATKAAKPKNRQKQDCFSSVVHKTIKSIKATRHEGIYFFKCVTTLRHRDIFKTDDPLRVFSTPEWDIFKIDDPAQYCIGTAQSAQLSIALAHRRCQTRARMATESKNVAHRHANALAYISISTCIQR